jgi:hypothetical protein
MLRSFALSSDHDSTMPEHDYRKLLRRTLMAMALCIAAVIVCYFWIDRPVAFFVYHHQINKFQIFRCLTYAPPELQTCSPLVLTVLNSKIVTPSFRDHGASAGFCGAT